MVSVSKYSINETKPPYVRVPNRFFGIRDLAYFKAGIPDFDGKGDSGL